MLDDEKLLDSIDDAQTRLGHLGRTKLYELIKDGELATVKIGRRSFITRRSIDAYVERLTDTK